MRLSPSPGKRILQSAAASIMTMSLSPPASKNQKKQNSIGSSGSASPTPQVSAKMARNHKLSVFKRPIEDVCRIRPPPDGRVEIPYVLTSGEQTQTWLYACPLARVPFTTTTTSLFPATHSTFLCLFWGSCREEIETGAGKLRLF